MGFHHNFVYKHDNMSTIRSESYYVDKKRYCS
uniref:Uncharacterized protein n=1 Tax=Arundo donax TaxID=35708 RepID=A0A0A9HMG6_ARUDO